MHVMGIESTDVLNFDDFYKFINSSPPEFSGDNFEELYKDDDISLEEFKAEVKTEYDMAIEGQYYNSDNRFFSRDICRRIASYIEAKGGFEIACDSIRGWDPQLIILTGENKRYKKKLAEIQKGI